MIRKAAAQAAASPFPPLPFLHPPCMPNLLSHARPPVAAKVAGLPPGHTVISLSGVTAPVVVGSLASLAFTAASATYNTEEAQWA